jgi:hypothetical protein
MRKLEKVDLFERMANELPILQEQECKMVLGGSGVYDNAYYTLVIGHCNLNFNQKLDIINFLCTELGFDSNYFALGTIPGDVYEGDRDTIKVNGIALSDGTAMIGEQSILWSTGNLFDIALLMVHEKNHNDVSWAVDNASREILAYAEQMNHPLYQYASAFYRNQIESQLQYWYGQCS